MTGGSLNGNYDTETTLGSGLYIFLVKNGSVYNGGTITEMYSAEGAFNWQTTGSVSMPAGWPSTMPLISPISSNRYSNYNDRRAVAYYNGSLWGIWHKQNKLTRQWELTRSTMGDEKDPFTLNGTKIFTPWSNPSSNWNNTTNYIGIQVFSQSSQYTTVKIQTTLNSCLSLEPSKPQMFKITSLNGDLNPVLQWESNLEPDLAGYKLYSAITNGSIPTTWTLMATVGSAVTTYTDDLTTGSTLLKSQKKFYAIKAFDNAGLLSEFSDFDWTYYDSKIQKANSEDLIQLNDPKTFQISSIYPNPFNPETTMRIEIPEDGFVSYQVIDLQGKVVFEKPEFIAKKGYLSTRINMEHYSSGLYFIRIVYNNQITTGKLLFTK